MPVKFFFSLKFSELDVIEKKCVCPGINIAVYKVPGLRPGQVIGVYVKVLLIPALGRERRKKDAVLQNTCFLGTKGSQHHK